METFANILSQVDGFVWGPVLLVLLIGTGLFLTVRLKFLPWRNLGYALKSVLSKEARRTNRGMGDISPFSALMTALAATIGTGNIVGVATAMVLGGPGALVWMWICAIIGLTSKYSECMLAIKFRETNEKGEMSGGPMYTMKNGFKIKWVGKLLAFLFALFTVLASFGIGNMTQANSISDAVHSTFNVPTWVTGLVIAVLALIILVGGIASISKVSSILVPTMAVFYTIGGLICVAANYKNIPSGIGQIFSMAFSPTAVAGGVGGTITASMMQAMRWGCARGVFSNEAGLGSAAISAAAATTDHPSRQGYISMTGTFFDTIVVCSITGLTIASSGVLGSTGADGKIVTGAALTIQAFSTVMGKAGGWIVTVGIALFAFSTIIGWEYHGEKALEYLVHKPLYCYIYRIVFSVVAFVGATTSLEIVWNFSDVMNGLMVFPNLISLIALSGVIAEETFDFQDNVLTPERLARKSARLQKETD
ncbi:sodium:alanine symporter family protein [Caproiciproducens sp. NJN-50]|uniref:alanine/glycine:cation symporter family protein n=1 Tax=Acutalibacteraceae TaxID=3082771 RepID=UPI000FFE08F2|nr:MULTISPECIES: sodium:alanine symporter family protein [Acutalibacteraceae]QAT50483.1 sodium:alanine symporter family protein [Caproiciproducens sp. NJN-50]